MASLLAALSSPLGGVRAAALRCVRAMLGPGGASHTLQPVADALLANEEEIVADPAHTAQALGLLFASAGDGSGRGVRRLGEALASLLECVASAGFPAYVARAALLSLEQVRGPKVLSWLLPVLERLLLKVYGRPCDDGASDGTSAAGLAAAASPLLRDEELLAQLVLSKFDASSCGLFASEPRCVQLLVRALRAPPDPGTGRSALQLSALSRITKEFFSALPSAELQQTVLRVLFDLLADCTTPGTAQAVGGAFKGLVVHAEQVALELVPAKPTGESAATTVAQARRQKQEKRREQQQGDGAEDTESRRWRRSTLILELLQHKKKLRHPEALVSPLFRLLSRVLEASMEEPEAMEYVKQLALACLLNVCTRLSPDGAPLPPGLVNEDRFSVELIVQCVRSSRTPQTHHHALLLLGAAASIFPEKVLHNIMPIFTFMGASVMRMDDAYSFQVIGKTVETVIPALIKAGGSAGADVDGTVTRVMRVFIEASPYVPEHRRAPVLVQLAHTVGPQRFLWALLLLALELRVTRTEERGAAPDAAPVGEQDVEAEREVEFWVTLCGEFSPAVQLASLVKVVQYLARLPQEKEDVPDEQPKPTTRAAGRASKGRLPAPAASAGTEGPECGLFSVGTHSAKQLRHFKFTAVSFLSQLLASPTFIAKVVACCPEELEELRPLEQSLLEEVLCYINHVAQSVEESAEQPAARFWRAMLNRAYDALDKVNALMPTESFVPVVRGLMGNRLPSVRRKAMELLNSKLLHHHASWSNTQVDLLLETLPMLLEVCRRRHPRGGGSGSGDDAPRSAPAEPPAGDVGEESEQAVNRQTALMSLKLLCRSFGAARPAHFSPALAAAVGLLEEGADEDVNVLAGALLCAAETTAALRALAVPLLPRLLPSTLGLMGSRKELLTHDLYLLSSVTALQRIAATLPHFLSPYLLDILMQLTHVRTIAPVAGPHGTQLQQRLAQLQTTLAQLPARVLLPGVSRAYDRTLLLRRETCLGPLFSMLTEHLTHIAKEEMMSHQAELTALFTKALDFRTEHAQDSLERVGEVEGHVITSLVAMVMKMSEVTFRPFFFKLFDWASGEERPSERLLTFYRLAERVAERLRGLFVLFAGHLVKPCAHLLNRLNVARTEEEAVFLPVGADAAAAAEERNQLLLQLVLDCLYKVFLYDTQHFITTERVNTLMLPLVDQLENTLGGDAVYQERVARHLVPCVAQFAVAMGDDTLWKPLNYQILLKTRHTSSKVRFAALLVLLEFASRLRENFTVLLPETIPFLAELMEDECEEVEKQCQKTVRELEGILGESLQSYF